jgi:tRNA(Ile)-lysidine synthase
MKGTRKVKDYFGDLGLPMEVRDRVPIVATEDEIVWVAGYAVSDLFAVTERTTRFVLIEVLNCEDE